MHTIAVGRFCDQHVATVVDQHRVTEQRQTAAAEIAGEDNSFRFSRVGDLQFGNRRAEDVSRFVESQADIFVEIVPLTVRNRFHPLADFVDVTLFVERLDRRMSGLQSAA